jgi:GrpB-like predicted nucleotidyltransferase (UPF0157 family)
LKRIVSRPYGFKWKGGIVMLNENLIKALKEGDVLEVKGIQVGTKQLLGLVRLMPYGHVAIHINGRLELTSVEAKSIKGKDGQYKVHYRTPGSNTQFFGLMHKAWLPAHPEKVVVLHPKKI